MTKRRSHPKHKAQTPQTELSQPVRPELCDSHELHHSLATYQMKCQERYIPVIVRQDWPDGLVSLFSLERLEGDNIFPTYYAQVEHIYIGPEGCKKSSSHCFAKATQQSNKKESNLSEEHQTSRSWKKIRGKGLSLSSSCASARGWIPHIVCHLSNCYTRLKMYLTRIP